MAFLIPTWKRPVVTVKYTLGRVYPRSFAQKDFIKRKLNNFLEVGQPQIAAADITSRASVTATATNIKYLSASITVRPIITAVANLTSEATGIISAYANIGAQALNAMSTNASINGNCTFSAFGTISNDSTFHAPLPEGGFVLGGDIDVNYITRHAECFGGLVLADNAFNPVIFNGYYVVSEQFQWNVEASFEIDLQFAWDVGNQILRYYQIEGQCTPPTCSTTGFDLNDPKCANGERFLTIIAATDLSDLCTKMQSNSLNYPVNWPIARIRRWSRPVSTVDIANQAAAGIDNTCNVLEDQMFCHVPECFDFCLNEDAVVSLGMSAFLQDRFYNYPAQGGLAIGGIGLTDIDRNLNPSGGFVLGGHAVFTSSQYHYVASSGLILSGQPDTNSSIWHYIGDGGLALSGTVVTKSPSYHYAAQGGLTIGSTARLRSNYHYPSQNFGISIGGTANPSHASLRFVQVGSVGTLTIGGHNTFDSNRFKYTSNGGLTLGGVVSAKSIVWHYYPSSGLTLGGSPNIRLRYSSNGGLILGGTGSGHQLNHMIGSGGLTLGGVMLINSSPTWHYNSVTGGFVLGGTSLTNFYALGTLEVGMAVDALLTLIEPIYPIEVVSALVPADIANVNESCGCNPIPNLLLMSHNIDTGANLKDFLARNSLTLPEKLNLIYNKFDSVWRANYHFAGIGSDFNESWTIVFEWGCSSEIGSEELGSTLWRFSVLIRKVLNNEQVETRILYTFPTAAACSNNMLQFTFKINTQTKLVVLPNDLSIRDSIIYDNVGLFVGKNWEKNPNLNINIFENALPSTEPTLDIKPIFPV